jgi:hypothetical protein
MAREPGAAVGAAKGYDMRLVAAAHEKYEKEHRGRYSQEPQEDVSNRALLRFPLNVHRPDAPLSLNAHSDSLAGHMRRQYGFHIHSRCQEDTGAHVRFSC